MIHIIRQTLNCVDKRLVGHGERVAFILYKILFCSGIRQKKKLVELFLIGLLHDIGAYKTEDIDHMVEFENTNIWNHSIYGYLFLKKLSPLQNYADAVLFHHLSYKEYDRLRLSNKDWHYGGLIMLADRIDLIVEQKGADFCLDYILKNSGIKFSPKWVQLFIKANEKYNILTKLENGTYFNTVERIIETASFSMKQKNEFLTMIAYSIDFRSEFMVLHTVTTVNISQIIARLVKIEGIKARKVYYGALLHDLGKVACPVEILEKPGRLTEEEMNRMKEHVVITSKILGNFLDTDIKKIAVRHHEKLDGSGYMEGLRAEELSREQRIVAIADIISALIRKRSYKEAFTKEATETILIEMKNQNKICPYITQIVLDHFDEIVEESENNGKNVLELYHSIKTEYIKMLKEIPNELAKQHKHNC